MKDRRPILSSPRKIDMRRIICDQIWARGNIYHLIDLTPMTCGILIISGGAKARQSSQTELSGSFKLNI